MLQVTRLLRGRVRIQRKTAKGHHPSSQSQTVPPTQGSTGSSRRRVSRQPTQVLSILPIRMTEESARRRHSYRQNKGWKSLVCPLPTPQLHSAHLCTQDGWLLESTSPGPPCPLVSSCAWPLGGTCKRLEDRQKGRQYLFQPPVPAYHLLSPMALQLCQ